MGEGGHSAKQDADGDAEPKGNELMEKGCVGKILESQRLSEERFLSFLC